MDQSGLDEIWEWMTKRKQEFLDEDEDARKDAEVRDEHIECSLAEIERERRQAARRRKQRK